MDREGKRVITEADGWFAIFEIDVDGKHETFVERIAVWSRNDKGVCGLVTHTPGSMATESRVLVRVDDIPALDVRMVYESDLTDLQKRSASLRLPLSLADIDDEIVDYEEEQEPPQRMD